VTPDQVDEAGFQVLLDHILQDRGLDCRQYKPRFLRRRFAVRMRALKVQSYAEYAARLAERDAEYAHLFSALTINLSYFFRDASLYDSLREEVLPALLDARRRARRLRIWSAGCAGGEEPYSLAMLLDELLGPRRAAWRLHIRATDVDATALDQARAGRYSRFSLQGADERYIGKYFSVDGDEYVLAPHIVDMVNFRQADLMATSAAPACDLILCRNVLIYFRRPQHERLFRLFHRTLPNDGVLVIGKTETLPLSMMHLFRPLNRREHIYSKVPDHIDEETRYVRPRSSPRATSPSSLPPAAGMARAGSRLQLGHQPAHPGQADGADDGGVLHPL